MLVKEFSPSICTTLEIHQALVPLIIIIILILSEPSAMKQASAKIAAEIDRAMSNRDSPEHPERPKDVGKLITDFDFDEGDGNGTPRSTPAREVKKYVRRRYTDSRHPTTELPDVRLEVPENVSVQYPPIRKGHQKLKAEEAAANAASSK